eukprot:TRINITY_DN7401_c0_g2_i1.p1 TRINITY_DN7401_c0_g2~~TRINITY_DN7401_c0_g2_i1.p1  ORF type:complete len:165 (+),score=48.14 TRINITY_DN7401_c0_g2_i1:50-496(+)
MEEVLSAGVVMLRETTGEREIFLMQRQYFKKGKATPLGWELPKGRVEKGETREEAAVRELEEETGLTDTDPEQLKLLDHVSYTLQQDGVEKRKTVVFFIGYAKKDPTFDLTKRETGTHSVGWYTEAQVKCLHHRNKTVGEICEKAFRF